MGLEDAGRCVGLFGGAQVALAATRTGEGPGEENGEEMSMTTLGPQLSIACICDAPVVNNDATITYPRVRHFVEPEADAFLAVRFVGASTMPPRDATWILRAPNGVEIARKRFPGPVSFATSPPCGLAQALDCAGLAPGGPYCFEIHLVGELVAVVPFGVQGTATPPASRIGGG